MPSFRVVRLLLFAWKESGKEKALRIHNKHSNIFAAADKMQAQPSTESEATKNIRRVSE